MSNYKTIPGFNDRYEVSETGIVRLTDNPESVHKRFWRKRISSFQRKDGLRVYTLTTMRKRSVITDVRAVGLAHVCPDQSKAFHLDSGKTLHPKNIIALDGIGKNNLYGRRKRKDCTSQYRGVYWHKHSKQFVGAVTLYGKTHCIPGDPDEKVVAERVDRKLDDICPDAPLSRFNFPDMVQAWRANRSRLDKCAAVARTKDFEPKYKDRRVGMSKNFAVPYGKKGDDTEHGLEYVTLEAHREIERENARLQMELDSSCNAEELRQIRENNKRLRDNIQAIQTICTTDHESKDAFIRRVLLCLSNDKITHGPEASTNQKP